MMFLVERYSVFMLILRAMNTLENCCFLRRKQCAWRRLVLQAFGIKVLAPT